MRNTRWTQAVGKDVEGKISSEVIDLAGLNWNVKQADVQFYTPNGVQVDPRHKMNYRDDNNKPLGIVGTSYRVLQNNKMFQFLDSVVGSMDAIYVNAGSFKGGRKVYIQAKLPGYIKFDNDQDIGEKLLTFISSHDGSMAVQTLFTPIRIICQNTIIMALKEGMNQTSIRHTISMGSKLNIAKQALNVVNGQVSILEQLSRKLIDKPFSDSELKELIERNGMVPKADEKSTRSNNIVNSVLRGFHYGQGSEFQSSKNTAWGAYNAVTEYVDHYSSSNREKRAESSLLGHGASIKTKTLSLLAA